MTWLKLTPYLAIAALLGAVLWLRGDVIAAKADRDEAKTRVDTLTQANASLQQTIDLARQMRVDNDAIAADVAARLDDNQVRQVHAREVIKETVRNDPEAAAWADHPVPDGVRAALRAGPLDAPAR